jgi:endonuclease/exonuclease/phosphatase family metal-dependent hydrolase
MLFDVRRTLIASAALVMLSGTVPSTADATGTRPSAATGLEATTTTSTVTMTWSKASHAAHYRPCIVGSSCTAQHTSTKELSWKFSSLKAGHHYDFVVYSYNSHGRAVSKPLSVTLPTKPRPTAPTGITQKVKSTKVEISWAPSLHTSSYSVCMSTAKTSTSCSKSSPRSSALTATFDGLKANGGGDYYYRVIAYNSVASTASEQQRVDLPVPLVQGVAVPRVRSSTMRIAWHATRNAQTYAIQLASNAAMTDGLQTHTVDGDTLQYDATGLTPGKVYYVRVDGQNAPVAGAFSAPLAIPLPTNAFSVDVVTYNLCGQDHCRSGEERSRIKAWSTRKPYAGKIARSTGADLFATQESGHSDTKFITQLSGFSEGAYISAKSIFYKTSRFTKLHSGTITLDAKHKRYAAWNEFQDKATRTPFYFVDAHLEPYKGKTRDDLRYAQTKVLIAAIAKVNTKHLPVIYAGDYNSNADNAIQSKYKGGYDAPLKAFKAAGIPDGITLADILHHTIFNSANQAINPPYKYGDHVDHIYVSPTVRVNQLSVILGPNGATGSQSFRYATPFASDHNPMEATVTVPGLPGEVG